jgi:AcrR family transcriptional regulator
VPPPRKRSLRAAARETASSVYRDAILEAAAQEFADQGYAATRMVDVARRAGMSVGALYRYFENKEAIFVCLMDRARDDVLNRMSSVAGKILDPRKRLAALVETMLGFIEDNRGMFLAFHQLGDADRAACRGMVEHSEDVRERMYAIYRAALEDGIGHGDLRHDVAVDDQLAFLTGAMHGFIEGWIRNGAEGRLVEKAPVIAHLTMTALRGDS